MANNDPYNQTLPWRDRLIRRFAASRLGGRMANIPVVAKLTKTVARPIIRKAITTNVEELTPNTLQTVSNSTLQSIVTSVVESLGYIGAMIATYEQGDVLPVRAFHVHPDIADLTKIRAWERELSRFAPRPVSITDPEVARVYRYNPEHRSNLSIIAVEQGGSVRRPDLYSLFAPIVPEAGKPIVEAVQEELGIHEVIAVPFFTYVQTPNGTRTELVGNLFAARRTPITPQDTLVLSALGQQAASLIESERRRSQTKIVQDIIYEMQASLQDERGVLQRIVNGIVCDLGYTTAMVGTLEAVDALVMRAVDVDPRWADAAKIAEWERTLSRQASRLIRLRDENTTRVNLYREEHQNHISVRAAHAHEPVTTNDLFDWFVGILPDTARPTVAEIQQTLNIQQIIAIPFYLYSSGPQSGSRELVGVLVVSTRSRQFSHGEIELLSLFSEQAAIAIRNARLYRNAEKHRTIAQTFAKMAFTSAAATHDLAGNVGYAYSNLGHLKNWATLSEERRQRVLEMLTENAPRIFERLQVAVDTLNQLGTPFKIMRETEIDVNLCVRIALERMPGSLNRSQIEAFLTTEYASDLPAIKLSSDMLIAALRAIIENAVEALKNLDRSDWRINIQTRLTPDARSIQVIIRDNGEGIPEEYIDRVFEMGYTTKRNRLGFGLFWTKDFIEGLGGNIQIESRRGLETTVTLTLPVQNAQALPSELNTIEQVS